GASAVCLVMLQLLLGQRLEQAQIRQLGSEVASNLILGEVALEGFSPGALAEISGTRLAVGPEPNPIKGPRRRFGDGGLTGQGQRLRAELCRRLSHCPAVVPSHGRPRGVWVEMGSPLEVVWLFAPLPSIRGWPPDPLLLSVSLGVGVLAAVLLFLSLEVQRPLGQLEEALEGVGLEERPAAVPLRGTGSVRLLGQRFNAMLERLEAASRERRTMLAGIAHDLRAPLTRLRLRLAEAGADEGATLRSEADLEALERITGQFLLFAGAGGDEPAVVVPLDALLAELAAVADARTLVLDTVPLERRVRPVALGRAIANLIDNALEHGCPPVSLVLRPGPGPDGFTILVRDAGEGIPPEQWARALEPFQRLDRARGGQGHCGLGLAIAERVAREHGGRLRAGSGGPGEGFEVIFEGEGLPA
ncbi:MAG: ATP-binding protein, partial [Cyanobium sp.]